MVAAANGIARNAFPPYVRTRCSASSRVQAFGEHSRTVHVVARFLRFSNPLPLLSLYICVCVCLHLSPRFGLTQLRVQTTRVNRFAHYKLLTPETLHDEECETIASVKLKRQVVKRRRRKGEDVVRLRKKTSRSSPSYLLLIGSIREMEDRPSPLRSDYPSFSFPLSLSLSFSDRIDIGSHCIESH